MREGLAEPLWQWLTESTYNLTMFEERRVIVVGIVGKNTEQTSKADPINRLLQRPVFQQHVASNNGNAIASIEAFYSPEMSTLFLHLSGYGDMCSLEYFLNKNSTSDDRKGFFENLSDIETEHTRCLAFLLVYSHALLFVDPGCRFDQSYCRALKHANELRIRLREQISSKLEAVEDFPHAWAVEGRLAQPRFLFAFHRHLLRVDLSSLRRRDLKGKLEQYLEAQISYCLRLHGLIGTSNRPVCGSISSRTPFVYPFSGAESPRDVLREHLNMLVAKGSGNENDESSEKIESDERGGCSNFETFLRSHIDEIRQSHESKFYEIPKLKWLLTGGKIIYELLFDEKIFSNEEIYKMTSTELQFSKSMSNIYVERAKEVYQADENKDGDERRKLPVFTKAQHEAKLERALQHLEVIYHGTELKKAKEKLKEDCEAIWATQKACEVVSLTGNQCILAVHHSLADLEVPASKRLPHSSGARFLSTCNCGHSQALRNDPFTLKEANYDFYMQSHFECCQDFERYEFEVFEQEATEGKLDDVESLDESLVSPKQSLVQSVYSVVEEDLEMLLDRDNRLEVDELHRDSPFKTEDLEIDDEETAVMEEKKDVVEEKDEPQQLAVEDEDDEDPELTKLVEPSGIRHLKAHMDEYTDVWSDEDEDEDVRSEGGERAPSYLDMAEEVQPREEPNTEIAKKLHTSAISFEEELAQLKKLCRGQFLDCVPNTESPSRKPLFPSWSLLCLGSSSIYSHRAGLRDMPGFKTGTNFLLPVDVYLTVDPEKWEIDMKEVMGDSYCARKRSAKDTEKVKLFVGFEYECPRGHRSMVQDVRTSLHGSTSVHSKDFGATLIRSDLPLWLKCTCRRMPHVSAQLMRLHVVTPKAPVTVSLNPRVQPTPKEPIYHTGESRIELDWARYYILRFPYVYAGAHGAVQRPAEATVLGKVLANCIEVTYTPLH